MRIPLNSRVSCPLHDQTGYSQWPMAYLLKYKSRDMLKVGIILYSHLFSNHRLSHRTTSHNSNMHSTPYLQPTSRPFLGGWNRHDTPSSVVSISYFSPLLVSFQAHGTRRSAICGLLTMSCALRRARPESIRHLRSRYTSPSLNTRERGLYDCGEEEGECVRSEKVRRFGHLKGESSASGTKWIGAGYRNLLASLLAL